MLPLLKTILLLPALLRTSIAYTTLSDDSLRALPGPGTDFDIHNGAILAPILVPRVPGSPGSDAVLTHFVNFFTEHLPQWTLSFQNSTSTTPTSGGKELPFRNLIATRDPPWVKHEGEVGRLALVAHYDSKITPDGFIGATDSAAPCAIILHAVRSIDDALTRKWKAMDAEGVGAGGFDGIEEHRGIQVLLLDGEEAFMTWTHEDSLYGARALAQEWESTVNPAMSTYQTPLSSIDLFVLLDLLGARNPIVPSYFKTTHWAYQRMAAVEMRLRGLDKFKTRSPAPFLSEATKKDSDRWIGGYIEDDHLPFMARGVEILHLIPNPFPRVWHTMEDDGAHLDAAVVEDWATLTTAFAAEWLELEGHFGVDRYKRRLEDEKTELEIKFG